MINNKEALQYFRTVSDGLHDDMQLLKNYFHISEFGYLKVFFINKKYFYLSSDPKMVEDYVKFVNEGAFFYNESIADYNEYIALLWPKSAVQLWMEMYFRHGYSNALTFIKRNKDGIDVFWVASKKQDGLTDAFYIKNTNIFITFMRHWLKKNSEVLITPKVFATYAKGVDFSNIDKIELNKKIEREKIKTFTALIRSNSICKNNR